MTESDLQAIEARCNAATPGPWTVEKPVASDDGWVNGVVIAATYGAQAIFAKNDKPARTRPTGRVYQIEGGGTYPAADQEFIAASRTDIPELIAEVRRLRRQLADALEVALAPERRYSTEAVEALLSACDAVDLGKFPTDAIGCGFGPVLDAVEAVRASRETWK